VNGDIKYIANLIVGEVALVEETQMVKRQLKQLNSSTRAISTLAIVLIVLTVVVAVGGTVVFIWWWLGSENLVSKEMDLSDFTIVEVGYAFEVEITQSSSYSVNITADEYMLVSETGKDEYVRERTFDYIQVSKTGDTLAIGLESGYTYRSEHSLRSLTLKAEITMPDIYELNLSGATRGTVEGFSSSHMLILILSGASSLDVTDTSAGDVEIHLSGASNLNGKGAANDLFISASGASRLELSDFSVHNANVTLSGASHATINLDGRLGGDLSGASHLRYIGDPTTVDVNTSGGSTVSKK
jgi:hypothetical protein